MIKIFLFAIFCLSYKEARAWGRIGHRIVAQIAQEKMTTKNWSKIKSLIHGHDLSMVANWPDEIKSDPTWDHSFSWHYVTIEDGKTYKESEKNKKGDLIEKLGQLCKDLKDDKLPLQKREEAVKWITHLIGDLHQPLHVGRSEDKGGNMIKLNWFEKPSNLHEVWDEGMIEMEQLSFSEYVRALQKGVKIEKNWIVGGVEDWAHEAMTYRQKIYQEKYEDKYWEYKYFYKNKELLNSQLMKGGVRLASYFTSCLK